MSMRVRKIICVYTDGDDREECVKNLEKELNDVISRSDVLDVRSVSISSIGDYLVGCLVVDKRK